MVFKSSCSSLLEDRANTQRRNNCGTPNKRALNYWFSHDVTKMQTKKLTLLLSFYFQVVLQDLKTYIKTDFRFKRVLRFAIQDA